LPKVIEQINASLAGWVQYLRVGNSSRAFSEVRDYTEMKVRNLLTRRKRRRKTSTGWRRWSNEYLYGVLGLYWGWKLQPLPGVEVEVSATDTTHNPFEETYWVSCLSEKLTSSSYGEGLETDRDTTPVPRQSLTRQNQGFNDAKNRHGLKHICHHHSNSLLISWLLTIFALTIARLYRLRYLHRGTHPLRTAIEFVQTLWLSLARAAPADTS
jgi:hypothetical protein